MDEMQLARGFELRPHQPAHLRALIESVERYRDVSGLAAAPGLRDFFVSGDVSSTYADRLQRTVDHDPWLHGFAIVDVEKSLAVGTAGFKGPPDEAGEVEIAYAIAPDHQGRGYASGAAVELVRIASSANDVRRIRAHTLPERNASTRVLAKAGFDFVREVVDPEDGPVWRWERAPERP